MIKESKRQEIVVQIISSYITRRHDVLYLKATNDPTLSPDMMRFASHLCKFESVRQIYGTSTDYLSRFVNQSVLTPIKSKLNLDTISVWRNESNQILFVTLSIWETWRYADSSEAKRNRTWLSFTCPHPRDVTLRSAPELLMFWETCLALSSLQFSTGSSSLNMYGQSRSSNLDRKRLCSRSITFANIEK